MNFPVLDSYLKQLRSRHGDDNKLWIDSHDRVQGKFLNCSLSSVFQPITSLNGEHLLGFEAHSYSYSPIDRGLSVWQLLMNAATDDESIELDRLARMTHVINFFRQPEQQQATLFIDVHDRLLTAVSSNHGAAFRRIVTGLGLPSARIILQLPYAKPSRSWALSQVVDNYKLNGFPIATRAADIDEAIHQAETLRPGLIRLDISKIGNGKKLTGLIERTAALSVQLIFGRLEYDSELALINEAAASTQGSTNHLFIQGPLIGEPHTELLGQTRYKNNHSRTRKDVSQLSRFT